MSCHLRVGHDGILERCCPEATDPALFPIDRILKRKLLKWFEKRAYTIFTFHLWRGLTVIHLILELQARKTSEALAGAALCLRHCALARARYALPSEMF
jgi:hypothetical protein